MKCSSPKLQQAARFPSGLFDFTDFGWRAGLAMIKAQAIMRWQLLSCCCVLFLLAVKICGDEIEGQVRILPVEQEKPIAATIRLRNGLILQGMCSVASTVAPLPASQREVDRPDQGLRMQQIDQGYRQIFVPVRRSEQPVPDVNAWPALAFGIPRERQPREQRPDVLPFPGIFDSRGIAETDVPGGSSGATLSSAIVALNELFAEVVSTTHAWNYRISLDAIPRQNLVSIVSQCSDFGTSATRRFEIVRMLMKAERYPEAGQILAGIAADFPEQLETVQMQLMVVREQMAAEITGELERRRDAGQHRLAWNGARLHPREDLTAEAVVRVDQLTREYDRIAVRVERIARSLRAAVAALPAELPAAEAEMALQTVLDGLDANSVDRLAAYELLLDLRVEDRPPVDEQLAQAFSGWLLGAEELVTRLEDVLSLFAVRQQVLDYLVTEIGEDAVRSELASQIARAEGVSVDRLAAMIRLLPAADPLLSAAAGDAGAGVFRLSATAESAAARIVLPAEYSQTRRWPLLLAFPRADSEADAWVDWWRAQTAAAGWILVVPVLAEDAAGNLNPEQRYSASAVEHTQVLSLLRRLKRGLCIDDTRVFAAGHGPGGEAAMDMIASHPQQFTGVVAVSTPGRRHLQWTAGNAIEKPWYVVIGEAHPFWYERMNLLSAKFFRRGSEIETYFDMMFVRYPQRGAESFAGEVDDILEWMQLYRREAFPRQIYTRILRSTDVDYGWAELKSVPGQVAQLDDPTDPEADSFRPGTFNIRTVRNAIIVESSPSDVDLFISPRLPDLDPEKPLRIVFAGRTQRIDYQPDVIDMLARLYQTGDHDRLSYMTIRLQR